MMKKKFVLAMAALVLVAVMVCSACAVLSETGRPRYGFPNDEGKYKISVTEVTEEYVLWTLCLDDKEPKFYKTAVGAIVNLEQIETAQYAVIKRDLNYSYIVLE
jgi:hypothetical protein